MKTDRLIDLLADGVQPVAARGALKRMSMALALGLPLSVAIVGLDYGFRADLAVVASLPMFWVKLLVPAVLAAGGFMACERLARPGMRVGLWMPVLVLPVAALWALAAVVLLQAPAQERLPLVLGQTWKTCTLSIGFIALPVFVAALIALRALAPTRAAHAGAAAGALAGGVSAAVYALHCPELQAPFLAVWYVAGIALMVLAGAVAGRVVLRW